MANTASFPSAQAQARVQVQAHTQAQIERFYNLVAAEQEKVDKLADEREKRRLLFHNLGLIVTKKHCIFKGMQLVDIPQRLETLRQQEREFILGRKKEKKILMSGDIVAFRHHFPAYQFPDPSSAAGNAHVQLQKALIRLQQQQQDQQLLPQIDTVNDTISEPIPSSQPQPATPRRHSGEEIRADFKRAVLEKTAARLQKNFLETTTPSPAHSSNAGLDSLSSSWSDSQPPPTELSSPMAARNVTLLDLQQEQQLLGGAFLPPLAPESGQNETLNWFQEQFLHDPFPASGQNEMLNWFQEHFPHDHPPAPRPRKMLNWLQEQFPPDRLPRWQVSEEERDYLKQPFNTVSSLRIDEDIWMG